MNNNKFDSINIPNNIDNVIEKGVKKALEDKTNTRKTNKLIKVVAASMIGIITLGVVNPALASKIPFIGNVFEEIEKNLHFPGNYSQYSTSVNETAYSNGIGVTLSDILCDGQSLYVTYKIENEEPFKNTSWENGKELDMNQLIISEKYNKVDFSDEQLDNTGFAGLEGKFIDEYTFIGVQKYHLSSLKEEIPDEFTFSTKINIIENYAINIKDKDYIKFGTWAFKIPVKVNKDLKQIVAKDIKSNEMDINSISITPFDMIIENTYKKGIWSDYSITVYNDNGKKIRMSESRASNDGKSDIYMLEAPNEDSKSIRIVVKRRNNEDVSLKNGYTKEDEEKVWKDIIIDKVIPLEK